MSFQERNILAGLIVALGFFVYYTRTVTLPLYGGGFAEPGGMAEVASQTLWIIGGSIVATIVATILMEIIYAIVTNSPNHGQIVDERDRLIERTGDLYGNYFSAVVFVGALFALANGVGAIWGIVIMTYGFFFGSLLSTMIRLFHHRRGY